ncbi:MAG TPA: DUF2079 domain-containing protein [Acidimicrobiia bacterium]|nr:DUF2079 domain-containing protein [Acidimicrobiia bacterium]
MDAVLRAGDDGGGSPSRSRDRTRSVFDHWIFGSDPRLGAVGLAVSGVLIVSYFLYFTHLSTSAYRGYGYGTFDLGFYDQGIWLLSRFHAPDVTLMGRNLFGDHAQFSLFALVPFYWIRPDASTLLAVQALVMAAGAIPVYLLAIRRALGPLAATVFVAAFLLHPALAQTNLENYHPDSFLIPLLGFAIYAALERRTRLFVVCCALALLCKEDAAAVVLPLALWYAWRRDRRVGGAIVGASIAVAFADTAIVMRVLSGVSTRNAYRIPFSACARACSVTRHMSDFVKTVVTKPATVVRYVVAGDRPNGRPFYVWQMIAPTGLAFLVAPEVAATVVLALAVNVFSTFGYQHQIGFHYSMELLPGLMMGTVYAVSRVRAGRRRVLLVALVGLSALASAYMWGPLPFSRYGPAAHWSPASAAAAGVDRVVAQIPAGAVVATYDQFAPHVDHREHVYLWPTPFFASHWKLFAQEGQRLPEADTVEYLLLPPRLADHPTVFDSIKADFVEVARAEDAHGLGAVLYRRVSRGSS